MLLGFGREGLSTTTEANYLNHLTSPGPKQVPPRNLLLQTAALLLLQQLHALRVPLAQPFHVARLVHLLAATFQATSIFLTGLLPAVRGREFETLSN